MIEGLKLDFTGNELRDHLATKSAHHRERQAFYDKQASALEAGNAEAMQYSGGDPVKALRDKAAQHNHRSDMFALLHNHITPTETYRLEDKDLTRLELISGGHY